MPWIAPYPDKKIKSLASLNMYVHLKQKDKRLVLCTENKTSKDLAKSTQTLANICFFEETDCCTFIKSQKEK